MDRFLRQAIEVVVFKDSQPFRQQVFSDLAARRSVIRIVMRLHRWLGKGLLSTLLVGCYGIKSFLAVSVPTTHGPILAAGRYRNELRQLDDLDQWLKPTSLGRINLGLSTLLVPRSWWALIMTCCQWSTISMCYRAISQANQTGDFLVACRVASTVGYFVRFQRVLQTTSPQAVLVCSDSNPYAMGLTFAAKSLDLKTIYINHGHIPDGPPPLQFDLSILDGPALADVYKAAGPIEGKLVYKGVEGDYRPLNLDALKKEKLCVGIFTSLVVNWEQFQTLVTQIQETLAPHSLLIRQHPNKVVREHGVLDWLKETPNVIISEAEHVLTHDAEHCDVVFVGNSSCHLTLLKYGVPTVYAPGLDTVPHDFYRFLELKLVPSFDSVVNVTWDAVSQFYSSDDWVERFQRFDHGYPNTDMQTEVAEAIQQVLND